VEHKSKKKWGEKSDERPCSSAKFVNRYFPLDGMPLLVSKEERF